MFFTVSKQEIEHDLQSTLHHINGFSVALDKGWKKYEKCFYKGYTIGKNLDEMVKNGQYPECTGNYTILDFTNEFSLHTDNSRAYPLYYDNNTVSNTDHTLEQIWNDASVSYNNESFKFDPRHDRRIQYKPLPQKNFNTVVDIICEYLVQCCGDLQTDLPLYAADSGGVDSLLVASAFDYIGKDYVFVNNKQHKPIYSDLWGYTQLYYSDLPHMQITGFCGDEVLLRNPLYCQWLLQSDGINLTEEYAKVSDSYMKGFFELNYKEKLRNLNPQFATRQDSVNHVANMLVNDFQMWHYNEVLTFTPFRNLWLIDQMLYADADTVVKQVVHAEVSRAAIKKLNPKHLQKISLHKNNKAPL